MSSNMDITFLGGLFPREIEEEIVANSIGNIDNAANVLQWNFINGLEANNGDPINIINSLYIGSYPKRYKKLYIKTSEFRKNVKSQNINVGFINIFGVKQYLRYFSIKKYLKLWANDKKENKVIIAYALTSVFVKALKYIKMVNPNIKTCIIVPDLPEYMNTSDDVSKIYKILKHIEIKSISKNLKYIDNFVLLTEQMSKALNVNNYIVVEGIATDILKQKDDKLKESKKSEKIILYTGTLNRRYGILNLISAFRLIDNKDYRLILCGYGDSINEVLEAEKTDKRIIFKGQIKREDVLQLQNEADVLINPRQNKEEFTKYSFPSKNLEYLSSGTPLIAYKLDGIPTEYDDYIYYIENDSIESLRDKIVEVCEKTREELNAAGKRAREFVLSEKNSIAQTKKIFDLLGEQNDKKK
ncbi:MAG: glycosyltransferase [Paeniclostridium sordellii]|uniref:Glycosyltransferase n=1 Tax=Paeniclostridium hominis TaxID=2764329 RepID=A0ABR7K3Y9_9FIRM|nr:MULTISPECIES: glycosyltransferase [Paeniclostridium]MBC6003811.1 glycosyltransferase [Paeniclostridium hominis]MDU2592371.1 glycosyltransferase [Paeniclostridium sordellii]